MTSGSSASVVNKKEKSKSSLTSSDEYSSSSTSTSSKSTTIGEFSKMQQRHTDWVSLLKEAQQNHNLTEVEMSVMTVKFQNEVPKEVSRAKTFPPGVWLDSKCRESTAGGSA